ncbi:prolyl oligopeptidase [Fragilariopsis cylindrus CCMP1102]|uniref:Prolyl oligopeptidase n=1 Tax=Fragilariopsis cylindrus CCMP1102 TaxID=635003 RepID=A0A1E7F3T3_9STRA|nr:prolyl oligopeptidase [Fragilariopsis cylindrus CCMP1102]|eukprot:OEU12784.1 prolyl oligopeptidase [Fragilariopsis cylindrus CCMP1102]
MELNNIHQQDLTLMESNDIHSQPDEILEESPHPSPPPPPVVALLSFGNILEQFPEFLIQVLSYIPDRTVWNSIASCNQDMYEKSKAYLPPWPTNYKLTRYNKPRIAVWSPCGTKIACTTWDSTILIFDQQHGPILHGDGNEFGLIAQHGVHINELKFSPDGRLLASATDAGVVRLWDSTTGGNYEQLQVWSIQQEIQGEVDFTDGISFSPCSRYLVVLIHNHVFLKDIYNEGGTIKSLVLPEDEVVYQIEFSSDGRAIFILSLGRWNDGEVNIKINVKIWRRPLDDANEGLITIWSKSFRNRNLHTTDFTLSNDNTMITVHDSYMNKIMIWPINTNHEGVALKATFVANLDRPYSGSCLKFTPDDKFVVCNTVQDGLIFWSIAEHKFMGTIHVALNENNKKNLEVVYFSPNRRQLLVWDRRARVIYITSYIEQKS